MNFNKQQEETINTIEGNVAVIASAGSGKTTVLTHRIKKMVEEHNILPSSILAITFSKKAKENINEKLMELNISNVSVETFHSFALKIISSMYGIKKFKIWTTPWEKEKTIKWICSDSLLLCDSDNVPYNEITSFIALQKNNMKTPNDDLIYTPDIPFKEEDMKQIYKTYEEYKEINSLIEFDDFLNMANKIFDTDYYTLEKYRNIFQYILVDEFQDISISQALLLRKLNTKNTMIVGDPLQAIYSFRGGDSRFILNFDTDYKDVKVINLNTNYRCSKDIVSTANKLALSIPDSQHKNYVESISYKGNFQIPELRHFSDDYEECLWVASKIGELKFKGYDYNDIAILARTNAQLQKLESTLHDEDIAFEIVDGKTFTELAEIKLIISYFKLALNTNDNESFSYLYNKPNRWLDKKFLKEVTDNSFKKNTSLYNSMFTIGRRNWRFKKGIDEIIEVINYLQNNQNSNISDLVRFLRNRLSIDKFVTKGKQSDDGSYIEQIDNLNSFENICSKYSSIKEFVSYIDELNTEMENKDNDKVKLLTIHKSKGMEYPVVFIIGCNEEILPHYKNENVNDERRLFYVAITRAEKELYLSYVDLYNGQTKLISSFIKDIEDTIKIIKTKKQVVNNK